MAKKKDWTYEIIGAIIIIIILVGLTLFYYNDTAAPGCGIQECHGLDITCGPDIPEVCTLLYKLGDNCRQFARCENGDTCQLVKTDAFVSCKSCAEECNAISDPVMVFECESKCVTVEDFCWSDEDCACGVHIDTGECFLGNEQYVDTEEQCPDFCTGILGNLKTVCTENKCQSIPFY